MTFTEFIQSAEAKQPHYLLIGNPVGHSVSPIMHNTALEHHNLEATYHAVSVSMPELPTLIAHFNSELFLGANVTIPHKQNFLDTVDELTDTAASIGAVNTILKQNGKLVGDNTDAFGFIQPLTELEEEIETDRAIVFGTGGATKAIVFALNDFGFEEVCVVSRRPERFQDLEGAIACSYDNWMEFADDTSLIVNATPLGMVPNTDASPIQDHEIDHLTGKVCYDIVYNPRETKFLKQAKQADGIPVGGLDMLIYQGAKSFELWTGKHFPLGLVNMKLDEVFPH